LPTIEVTNVGPVVEPIRLEELIKPFHRADGAGAGTGTGNGNGNGHGQGLGLGLSIVQAIAEAHGAALRTEARPEGGLRVSVAFPASGPESND